MITRRLLRPSSRFTQSPWTCAACTQRIPFITPPPQVTATTTTTTTKTTTRSLSASSRLQEHTVTPLGFHDTFSERGVRDKYNIFLTPEAYHIGWVEYQTLLTQKLNELTAGQDFADKTPLDLALIFARDPLNAALFNHASMAFNNHFFYNALSPRPLTLAQNPQLTESLILTFGSIETLRATMIDTAASMFGPGFVWLVWARDPASASRSTSFSSRGGSWRILNTYLAGTPFPEAGYRQQGLDMSNNNPNSYQAYLQHQASIPGNTAGMFGPYSQTAKQQATKPPGGTSVMPVLCVNTWEHVYLHDYGVSGKRKYVENWWNWVDWGLVQERAPMEAMGMDRFERSRR